VTLLSASFLQKKSVAYAKPSGKFKKGYKFPSSITAKTRKMKSHKIRPAPQHTT
jgi:hypothetical protein